MNKSNETWPVIFLNGDIFLECMKLNIHIASPVHTMDRTCTVTKTNYLEPTNTFKNTPNISNVPQLY